MVMAVPRAVHRSRNCTANRVTDIRVVSAAVRVLAQRGSALSRARRRADPHHCLACPHRVALQQRRSYSSASPRRLDVGFRRCLFRDDASAVGARRNRPQHQPLVLVDSPDDLPPRPRLVFARVRSLSFPSRRNRSEVPVSTAASELISEHRLVVAVPVALKNFRRIEPALETQEFWELGISRGDLPPLRPPMIREVVAPSVLKPAID